MDRHLVVTGHPEDLLTEFMSVLERRDAAVRVLVAADGRLAELPPGGFAERVPAVLALAATATATADATADVDVDHVAVGALVAWAVADGETVWTHSPADERLDRAKVAVWAALAAGRAHCSTGLSAHLKFVADVTMALTGAQITAKLDVLGEHFAPQIERAGGPRGIGIASVVDCERYVTATGAQAARLFSLRHDWHPDVDLGAEPWDFASSPYERQRLRSTADWVRRHVPAGATLVELGSCEGALTDHLLADGYAVSAQEPVVHFAERFAARVGDRWHGRLEIGTHTLEELADGKGGRAAAYLLVEMLNYIADLSIVDRLDTDLIVVSMSPFAIRTRIMPWLRQSPVWEVVEVHQIIAPRFELVCDGLAYHRKLGSTGVLARRR
jgi:hypothetical protein